MSLFFVKHFLNGLSDTRGQRCNANLYGLSDTRAYCVSKILCTGLSAVRVETYTFCHSGLLLCLLDRKMVWKMFFFFLKQLLNELVL